MEGEIAANRFLVCGLGSLGQHCVAALEEFGAQVTAISETTPKTWEIPGMKDALDLFFGDCRQGKILEQAGIRECRGILLVTSSEQVNIEAAFVARSLNPHIRLVVRSGKKQLNEILAQHLGNFIAFEPDQLPAAAFALAALGAQTLGCFKIDNYLLRVVKGQITDSHPWRQKLTLQEINRPDLRVLCHEQKHKLLYAGDIFHDWEPTDRLDTDDNVIYVEVSDYASTLGTKDKLTFRHWLGMVLAALNPRSWQRRIIEFFRWTGQDKIRTIAAGCFFLVLALGIWGTLLFGMQGVSLENAFATTATLILGGYGDIFGGITDRVIVPLWLQLFALLMTLTGIALTGVLYGLLTDSILSLRLRFLSRRPPVPDRDHVVLVGLGQVGQRVAEYLQEFRQPLVALHGEEVDSTVLPQVPVITGDLKQCLQSANLATAKSIITVTDDEMTNLELGLVAQKENPHLDLVIRTFEPRFSSHLSRLLPHAQVLCAYALAAEAFAAGAYGENVLSLFQLRQHTILVTEYTIEAGDTLHGKLITEVAYGYGVFPVLYQSRTGQPTPLPSYDIRLKVGDRLIVLATTDALHRIELGRDTAQTRRWRLCVTEVMDRRHLASGVDTIVRITGCQFEQAREVFRHLPGELDVLLFKHQGLRLVRELASLQISAHLIEVS
ncbi:MAG: NAD-binding protein [Pseudanabaenaceae cyanobacterium SKYGB_i_bin29]|nr:NAD-binding protein [Pseudanabaenaceae cyanobacterium SKYG29]MDW8421540.1 NAD-binding protein [Pseudanabaenaceae cyanobacterium SKYGB_i_bin29]